MQHDDDEFDLREVSFHDNVNSTLQGAATAALRQALHRSATNISTVDDLWHVFRDHLTRYQYGEFLAEMVGQSREAIRQSIARVEYKAMRKEALAAIKKDEYVALKAEAVRQSRQEIEAQGGLVALRIAVDEDLRAEMRPALEATLIAEVRAEIEQKVRAELKSSAAFIAEAKAELKRELLDL